MRFVQFSRECVDNFDGYCREFLEFCLVRVLTLQISNSIRIEMNCTNWIMVGKFRDENFNWRIRLEIWSGRRDNRIRTRMNYFGHESHAF